MIWAAIDGLDFATAQQIAQLRLASVFDGPGDLVNRFPNNTAIAQAQSLVSTQSAYFEVWVRLRFDDLVVQEKSLVYRQNIKVTTVVRERGASMPASLMGEGAPNARPAS